MPPPDKLVLSRMDLDDAGDKPERIAEAIHLQLQAPSEPVPVDEIATALDIYEIRVERLSSIEGCLLTQPERTDGAILVNGNASKRRRRFTIAHELGHFLIATHVSPDETGFNCRSEDMIVSRGGSDHDLRKRQEAEANLFAINLLAPRERCRRFLRKIPDLNDIVALSDALDISREAAARRYVELHREPTAVLFIKSGRVAYVCRHEEFPFVKLGRGDVLPRLRGLRDPNVISDHVEADADDWLGWSRGKGLVAQRLRQEDDRETILIAFAVD
jgi:Zn-dependent peptidase ImmA (M78 family)